MHLRTITVSIATRASNGGAYPALHFLPFMSKMSVSRYSLDVPAQPDGGEVAPAQLADHMVPAVEQVPDLDQMVSSCGTGTRERR